MDVRQHLGPGPIERAERRVRGRIVDPFEVPERSQRLAARLGEAGHTIAAPAIDDPVAGITRVHPTHFVEFLKTAHAAFSALDGAGPEVLPNVHPHVSGSADGAERPPPRATDIVGRAGWYLGDMACAIGPGTFEAACASVASAIRAATTVIESGGTAMALCRPPGHHAYRDRASGFCFFNNAAIAAEALRARYPRIAILDFDTHHGDGTQAIYFGDAATFVGSTHTDPTAYYPFYCGYADETGLGDGAGTNLNVPLAPGADDAAFLGANDRILSAAADFAPDAIIISAGWDAHRDDPLSRLDVSSPAFAELGLRYGALGLPTVIVQEGGYSLSAIEDVAPRFLAAFEEGRL